MHHANKPQATPLFFFPSSCPPLTTKSPRRLSPSGFLLQTPLRSELETTSTCCLFKFSRQSPAAFPLTLRSPYPHRLRQPFSSPNHTPHPTPTNTNHQSFAAILLRSRAYWRVPLERPGLRFCACTQQHGLMVADHRVWEGCVCAVLCTPFPD